VRHVLTKFLRNEDGGITVDWVVLTAAVVGLQVAVLVAVIRDSLTSLSESSADTITEYGEYLNN
jgi:Flp pilus assembly pilin Flp